MEKSDKSSMFSLAKESLGEDKESLNKVEKPEDPSLPSCSMPGGATPLGSKCASVQAAPEGDLGALEAAADPGALQAAPVPDLKAAVHEGPGVVSMQLGQVMKSYFGATCFLTYDFLPFVSGHRIQSKQAP